MIPIYFPFTYIPAPLEKAVESCFGSIAVYQPSGLFIPERLRQQENVGLVNIRIPEQSGEEQLRRIQDEYTRWAALHQGNQLDFLKVQGPAVPFFEELSTARIKADIKKNKLPADPEPLFNARLFLQLAQDFDAKNDELEQQLLLTKQTEQALFKHLRGGDDLKGPEDVSSETRAGHAGEEYMTLERLTAWGHLFLQDQSLHATNNPMVMVTNSRKSLEMLQEYGGGIRQVLCIKNIPLGKRQQGLMLQGREKLSASLSTLAEKADTRNETLMFAEDGVNGPAATLSVFAVAQTHFQFFLHLVRRGDSASEPEYSESGHYRTLFGLIDIG